MASVTFWRGTRTQFAGLQTKDDARLYFITDQNVIYKGSNLQGTQVVTYTQEPATPVQGVIYVNSDNGQVKYRLSGAWVSLMKPVVTAISASSTDAQVPTAKAVYTAIDTVATQLGGSIREPVQTVAQLAAITQLSDKLLCFVQDAGSLYRYDEQATGSATGEGNAPNTVIPTDGTGVWYRMFTAVNLTGDDVIQVNGLSISLKYSADDFEADATNGLKLKNVQRTVTGAVADNIATFNASGNVKDSGVKVVTSVTSASADTQLPTAKAVYDYGNSIASSAQINWLEAE